MQNKCVSEKTVIWLSRVDVRSLPKTENWASSIELYSLTEKAFVPFRWCWHLKSLHWNVFFSTWFLLHLSFIFHFTLFLRLLKVTQFFSAAPSMTDNLLETTNFERCKNFCTSMYWASQPSSHSRRPVKNNQSWQLFNKFSLLTIFVVLVCLFQILPSLSKLYFQVLLQFWS